MVKARASGFEGAKADDLTTAASLIGLDLGGREIVIGSRYAMATFTRSELLGCRLAAQAVAYYDALAAQTLAAKVAAARALLAKVEAEAEAVAAARALVEAAGPELEPSELEPSEAGPVVAEA